MTWIDFMSARHLLAEKRVGTAQRAEQIRERDEIEETKARIRQHQGI